MVGTNGKKNADASIALAIEAVQSAIDFYGEESTLLLRALALLRIVRGGHGEEGDESAQNLRVREGAQGGVLIEVLSPDMAVFLLQEEVLHLARALQAFTSATTAQPLQAFASAVTAGVQDSALPQGEMEMVQTSKPRAGAGWARPTDRASKWHYFPDGEARSLCGRYLLLAGERGSGNDSSSDNCSVCRRKKLKTDEAEA